MVKRRLKDGLKDIYWGFYGLGLRNPALRTPPRSFLFVCKGNICRSPFAERYAMEMARRMNLRDSKFLSVGLEVSQSLPPPAEAVLAAAGLGINLEGHRSREIRDGMLATSDLIVVMDVPQLINLRRRYPCYEDKIFLLPLFRPRHRANGTRFSLLNIEDPYGKPVDHYRFCFTAIRHCLDVLFQQILTLREAP